MGIYTQAHNATPSTPSAGQSSLYPKSDDLWYYIDDNGNERLLLASTNTAIAANRIPYASATAGIFTSSANLTFDGTTLTAHTLTISTGALTVTGGSLVTGAASSALFNTVATTLNIGGAATTLNLGAATGTATIANASTVVNGTLTVSGATVSVTSQTGLVTLGAAVTAEKITGGLIISNGGIPGILLKHTTAGRGEWEIYASDNVDGSLRFYERQNNIDLFILDEGGILTLAGNQILGSAAGTLRLTDGARIGADSTNNLLDDASTGAGSATLYIGNASINVTSDERVKAGLRLWEGNASALLRSLPVKEWDRYLSDAPMGGYDGKYVGFTSQDIRAVAPYAVNTQGDTGLPWQARYEFLNGIIVKGWQEHDETLSSLLAFRERAINRFPELRT